jgi:hypothetical protein
MPQFRFLSTLSLMFLALAPPAANAQEINPLVRERIVVQGNNPESRSGQVRVQASINVFMPGPSGEGEAAEQLRERARRMIYQIASRECGVLEEVLARTCRLEAINVNLNRQMGQMGGGVGEGYMVAGSMTMVVTLK